MKTAYFSLAVGDNINIHHQAQFALLSVMAHNPNRSLLIVTDYPEHYKWLAPAVTPFYISNDQLKSWRGEQDYFFRIKLKALQKLLNQVPSHLVYFDSDTVCLSHLSLLEQGLANHQCFMHDKEFPLHTGPTKTTRQMWRVGKGQTFGPFLIDQSSVMWNSGVVALPQGSSKYVEMAIEACDALCRSKMRPYFVEQFALGLALSQSQKLNEAKQWFLHYWDNKVTWQTTVIEPFLLEAQKLPLEKAADLIHQVDPFSIKKPVKLGFFKKIQNKLGIG
ncbi:MAG: hypothetical protein JSR33_11315 [Proteobacteria bacterium]|nr:hypothetical protein [Pseudomonadota bacterium]